MDNSGSLVLPKKLSNNVVNPTEMMEGRGEAKGNAEQTPASGLGAGIVCVDGPATRT